MHAVVLDVLAVEATLVPEVLLELLVDVVGHRFPARAETHRVMQTDDFEANTRENRDVPQKHRDCPLRVSFITMTFTILCC